MRPYQQDFLQLAVSEGVLRFGRFTLKSGRISPYFFNLGCIAGGAALERLARAYASALAEWGIDFELVFGPAYKGIPLATALALALTREGRDVAFAYDRKEVKDHGEGGMLVGAPVRGRRVLIVDDVLTAGTALRASLALLRANGARPVGALIALDRQERGRGRDSAVAELQRELELPVRALVGVGDILEFLGRQPTLADADTVRAIREYQAAYGAAGAVAG